MQLGSVLIMLFLLTQAQALLWARKHALGLQAEVLALFSTEERSALLSYFSRCNGKLDELD